MEAGIVGLPQVGKTTLFNALTNAGALDANAQFASLKPNVGVASIPEPRLDVIASLIPTQKIIPATMRLVDIAGIAKGASEGEGLGNKFLSHIREVDAVIHVVRCFEQPGGAGAPDPLGDIEVVNTELILADYQTVDGALGRAERAAKGREAEAVARYEALKKVHPVLSAGQPARSLKITDPEQAKQLRSIGLITAKKTLYVMNVDEADIRGESAMCAQIRVHAAAEGSESVAVCAKIESELTELSGEDRAEMLASLGLKEPALAATAHGAYRLLGLQSFFTAGPKEVRAWTISIGATAPQAAGAIHTDFERGFIRVEVYSVDDLVAHKTEKAIREAGKMRVEGKAYVMRDGDVCHFLFNT